jgi:predicted amidophosphoribosyltransferase
MSRAQKRASSGRSPYLSRATSRRAAAIERLRGRPVVIVDDVITTGATVKAVTRALHRAGIDNVDVISFARVTVSGDLS